MIQKDWSDWEMNKGKAEDLPPPFDPSVEVEQYEIMFKVFYGMIPAPTPLPATLSIAPSPSPKANSKTKGV